MLIERLAITRSRHELRTPAIGKRERHVGLRLFPPVDRPPNLEGFAPTRPLTYLPKADVIAHRHSGVSLSQASHHASKSERRQRSSPLGSLIIRGAWPRARKRYKADGLIRTSARTSASLRAGGRAICILLGSTSRTAPSTASRKRHVTGRPPAPSAVTVGKINDLRHRRFGQPAIMVYVDPPASRPVRGNDGSSRLSRGLQINGASRSTLSAESAATLTRDVVG